VNPDTNRSKSLRQTLRRIVQPIAFVAKSRISSAKRLILGRNVEALLIDTDQGLFLIEPEDVGVGGLLIKRGSYGEDEIERISSITSRTSRVLFVGAHIGALAIPISKKVKQVTAIEANPLTFRLLSRNILLNRCENIYAIQIAASDKKGDLEYVVSRANSGGSKRMPLIRAYKYFYDHPSVVKVEADMLDNVVSGEYDVIVMDIEGSEYFALKGMERILSQAAYLIVEFVPHHLRNVSNVSVREFLQPIMPHFSELTIPSRNLMIDKSQFVSALESMYEANEEDDGIIFSKN
jgi:FkbM family methyltransferase